MAHRVRTTATARRSRAVSGSDRCRRKFLRFFPGGFQDETYYAWERGYKWRAHEQWMATLGPADRPLS